MPVIRSAWATSMQSVDGINMERIKWSVMAYFCEHCNGPSGYVRSGESLANLITHCSFLVTFNVIVGS